MAQAPQAGSWSGRVWPTVLMLALALVLLLDAWMRISTTFRRYDDEGYMLIQLKHFSEGHAWFDQVYSQYGPGYAVLGTFLLKLTGLGVSHDAGRVVTTAIWVGVPLLLGFWVWRWTRSWLLGLAAEGCVYLCLWQMVDEPMHPGGMLALGLSLGAISVCELQGKGSRWAMLVAGIWGGLLAAIKINVGFFWVLGIAVWWGLSQPVVAIRRITFGVAVLVPLALVRPLADQPEFLWFGVLFSLGAALAASSVLIHSAGLSAGRADWGVPLQVAAGFFLSLSLMWGAALLGGSSLEQLLQGSILQPMQHPGVFRIHFYWQTVSPWLLAAVILAGSWSIIRWSRIPVVPPWVGGLSLCAILIWAIWWPMVVPGLPQGWPLPFRLLALATASAWVFFRLAGPHPPPLRGQSEAGPLHLLGWLGFWQGMHAFPVAGSQVGWGVFLAVSAWCIVLAKSGSFWGLGDRWKPIPRVFALVLLSALVPRLSDLSSVAERYYNHRKTNLVGASTIRFGPRNAAVYSVISSHCRQYGTVVASLPGLFSFNLWTERPTPTLRNVTHWFNLLSSREQQDLRDALLSDPGALVLLDRGHLDLLSAMGIETANPLSETLGDAFEPALDLGEMTLFVRRGRQFFPMHLAVLSETEGSGRFRLTFFSPRAPDKDSGWSMAVARDGGSPLVWYGLTVEAVEMETLELAPPTPGKLYRISISGEAELPRVGDLAPGILLVSQVTGGHPWDVFAVVLDPDDAE